MTAVARLTTLGLLLVLAGCGLVPKGDGLPPDAPVLRIGTSGDYAPFSRDGRGFDVDVATHLAADLGFRIQWRSFRWPELQARVAANEFDVVMSGVTWRPERAVVGWFSRAVARGGPCWLVARKPVRVVGVNAGGFLEAWARSQPGPAIVTVSDNTSLPMRLARGEFDAIATDSFELRSFRALGPASWTESCAEPRHQKAYWVAPARAATLGPRLDRWLQAHASELAALRTRHFGAPSAPDDAGDHLVDLFARRLAFMPHVAAWKRARGVPLEDVAREKRVLEAGVARARELGADPERAAAVLRAQIALAKALQARAEPVPSPLDLEREVRPALLELGDRIVEALAHGARPTQSQLARLTPPLTQDEVAALARALD